VFHIFERGLEDGDDFGIGGRALVGGAKDPDVGGAKAVQTERGEIVFGGCCLAAAVTGSPGSSPAIT
jgi:hypothetical protein